MHSSEIHSGLFSPTVETVGSAPEGKCDKPDLCISQPWATCSSAHYWGSLCPPAAGAEQGHCSRRLWDRAGWQGRQVGVHTSGAPGWLLPCVPGQVLMERNAWGARATCMGTQGGDISSWPPAHGINPPVPGGPVLPLFQPDFSCTGVLRAACTVEGQTAFAGRGQATAQG